MLIKYEDAEHGAPAGQYDIHGYAMRRGKLVRQPDNYQAAEFAEADRGMMPDGIHVEIATCRTAPGGIVKLADKLFLPAAQAAGMLEGMRHVVGEI